MNSAGSLHSVTSEVTSDDFSQPSMSSMPGSMHHSATHGAGHHASITHIPSNASFPSAMSMHTSYPGSYHHALLQNPFHNAMLSHHNAHAHNTLTTSCGKDKGKAIMQTTVTDVASTSSASSPQINSMSFTSPMPGFVNSFGALAVEGNIQHPWILDSGAIDHVTSSLSWFTTYTVVQNLYVHLLDCSVVQFTHIGTVHLSAHLILYDVLFVPSFTYNLISTGKLTARSFYYLTMYTDKILI